MTAGRPAGGNSPSLVNQGADYTDEERAFLVAIDEYKRSRQRPFPSWREVLAVVHALGYRLTAGSASLPTLDAIVRGTRRASGEG